jgi:hypothetical protein
MNWQYSEELTHLLCAYYMSGTELSPLNAEPTILV